MVGITTITWGTLTKSGSIMKIENYWSRDREVTISGKGCMVLNIIKYKVLLHK